VTVKVGLVDSCIAAAGARSRHRSKI